MLSLSYVKRKQFEARLLAAEVAGMLMVNRPPSSSPLKGGVKLRGELRGGLDRMMQAMGTGWA